MREGMQGRIRERVCACVKQHIQTVSSLEGSFLPYHFVEEYGEDRCRELCGTIEDYGVAGSIQKLSEEGKKIPDGGSGFSWLPETDPDGRREKHVLAHGPAAFPGTGRLSV